MRLASRSISLISRPELYDRIRGEAEALFANGDPGPKDFTTDSIDVTHRVLMEIMRLYPTIPMSVRHVMNSFTVEGFAIPEGSRIYIAQTAPHYMEKVFPDPFSFDIDRYQSPRNEHRSPGYAPYGLGTHTCFGFRWVELQLAVNLLMLAHYFTLEMSPANSKLKINPISNVESEQEVEVHHRRAKARTTRLTRCRTRNSAAAAETAWRPSLAAAVTSPLRRPPNGIHSTGEGGRSKKVAGL